MAIRPASQAGSALDGCLLIEALQEALSRLTAAAFVRKEVAQKIISVARQELIRVLIERAPSLPWLCVSSHLRLYRHSGAGSGASCGTWLMILEQSLFAAYRNATSAVEAATAHSLKLKSATQLADALLVQLRRQQLSIQQKQQHLQQHAARSETAFAEEDAAGEAESYEVDPELGFVDETILTRQRSVTSIPTSNPTLASAPSSQQALLANAAVFSHEGFLRAFLHDRIGGTESFISTQTQRGAEGRKRKAGELLMTS